MGLRSLRRKMCQPHVMSHDEQLLSDSSSQSLKQICQLSHIMVTHLPNHVRKTSALVHCMPELVVGILFCLDFLFCAALAFESVNIFTSIVLEDKSDKNLLLTSLDAFPACLKGNVEDSAVAQH